MKTLSFSGVDSMYSNRVLDHLENPRNVGAMTDATASGKAENPVCGDLLHLYLKVDSGCIVAATFKARGCPPTLAASSVLTEMITGLTVDQASSLKPQHVATALDSLPRNKEHCCVLAIDALRAALAALPPAVI